MSKRDLKKYLESLDKEHLENQIITLYEKFPDVKEFYNFAFHPKEDKLLGEAKLKIAVEYFPPRGKRAKMRRSVAQKYIKKFLLLGVDPHIVAEVMLYAIETAVKFAAGRTIRYESFYKSYLTSFSQAAVYIHTQQLGEAYPDRLEAIVTSVSRQRWPNAVAFEDVLETLYD